MRRFLSVALMLVVLCSARPAATDDTKAAKEPAKASVGQDDELSERTVPREFEGQPSKPKGRTAPDAADWNSLQFDAGSVKALKVYGFKPYNAGKPLNVEIKDAATLKTIEWVAHQGSIMRTAMSDVGRGGAAGDDYLGVLKVQTAERELVIGVSYNGFFLGTYHGSTRQIFYSWGLAKQVDELLFKATGKHLEKEHFEALSGERMINLSKQHFEKARGKKGG